MVESRLRFSSSLSGFKADEAKLWPVEEFGPIAEVFAGTSAALELVPRMLLLLVYTTEERNG